MNYRILLTAFCLGILIGVTIFASPTITGQATEDCYLNNQLCECQESICNCGDRTISAEYCQQASANSAKTA